MTSTERKAAFGLASVVGMRMLGLFIVLPVFTLLAVNLEGATPVLVGIALGVYGLTQAAMQIPMGALADKLGRRPVIAGGLMVFFLGSVLAALADNMTMLIAGRALQGLGAVAGASMALAADLSRESQREKVMAIIGITIGAAFMLAMMLGPAVASVSGLSGIFWLTASLALVGLVLLFLAVPVSQHVRPGDAIIKDPASGLLLRPVLLRLDASVFLLHFILTAFFFSLPLVLVAVAQVAADEHWKTYIPVMLLSVLFFVPALGKARRSEHQGRWLAASMALMAAAQLWFYVTGDSYWMVFIGLTIFFACFNFAEATLPAILSRQVISSVRGRAMGAYASSQFLGAFAGGLAAGLTSQTYGNHAVFLVSAIAAGLVVPLMYGVKGSGASREFSLALGDFAYLEEPDLMQRLVALPGVVDVVIMRNQGYAQLKFNRHPPDLEEIRQKVRDGG